MESLWHVGLKIKENKNMEKDITTEEYSDEYCEEVLEWNEFLDHIESKKETKKKFFNWSLSNP